eukprot:s2453_g8.t1
MHELGVLLRLSALALLRAIALRRRAASEPRYRQEHDIFECAKAEPTSWAAAVSTTEVDWNVPFPAAELCQSTLAQLKAKLHHHVVSVLQPAIHQLESRSWMSSRKNTQYLQGVDASHWTIQQMAELGASVRDCRAGSAQAPRLLHCPSQFFQSQRELCFLWQLGDGKRGSSILSVLCSSSSDATCSAEFQCLYLLLRWRKQPYCSRGDAVGASCWAALEDDRALSLARKCLLG